MDGLVSLARRSLAVATGSALGGRIARIKARLRLRRAKSARSTCVELLPPMVVWYVCTRLSCCRIASTLEASCATAWIFAPGGGETVIGTIFCDPVLRKLVGILATVEILATKSTAAKPSVTQRWPSAVRRTGV